DDGIVVYVNGTEVLRRNLDPGTLSHNYYASSSPNAQTAITNLATVVVPGSAFVTGTNVISAEVHSGYRSTPSHSFELTAVGSSEAPTVPEDPPDPPDDPGDPPDDPDTLIAAASN